MYNYILARYIDLLTISFRYVLISGHRLRNITDVHYQCEMCNGPKSLYTTFKTIANNGFYKKCSPKLIAVFGCYL